ncbi:ADP-ribosylglycohydrolase family protein [Chitinophaga varians]|uniref:ADP-ribosylglycohydrolase family protein n=1 Tax=Chitinophaga varians TaxID=2202339 RepID=A0A847S206_9BACT|nr:ADP-ribosylglycohydrolase family protein [Chitinophaga varians]NLR65581.1 ADP-ribosylglycohydrolase family protein [Chitinophaga varians]
MQQQITGAFLGTAIGDALGVPVEFKTRSYLQENPIREFIGYGCWNQPPGTFSDDTSLTLCTAESLTHGYNLTHMAHTFLKWYADGYWGAHDKVFDIGHTTQRALRRIGAGTSPLFSGGFEEFENGNGSLMRMMPVAIYLAREESIKQRYHIVKEVSGITHLHFRSVMACFIYVEFLRNLLTVKDIQESYQIMQAAVNDFIIEQQFNPAEIRIFNRILQDNITNLTENDIQSSGYVVHTLESALWCLLNTGNYQDAVLAAVNLGGDTDTTGAVAGAAAGLHYGLDSIPVEWVQAVAKSAKIIELSQQFTDALSTPSA